jgi:hypothetical protein
MASQFIDAGFELEDIREGNISITEVTHHQFIAEWTRPIRPALHVLMSTRTETKSGQCQADFS